MRASIMIAPLVALLPAACSFKVVSEGSAGGDGGRVDAPKGTPYKKLITIDQARVTGGQTQFPVWIVLDGDADLKAHATDDGSDIYFTAGDGAQLSHEIQRWTRTAGRLEAWVRTDLNAAAPTVLELRYGDPSSAIGPNPQLVFASSFAAVWHLDDPLDTAVVADATGKREGAAGGLGPADQVGAQLGGGVDFKGGNQRVNFTLPLTGNSDHTISAWVNQRTVTGFDTIIAMGNPNQNQSRWFHSHYLDSISAGFFGNDWPSSRPLPSIDNAGWVLLHWTYKGANRQSSMYRNGVVVQTHTFSSGVSTQGPDGNLGYAPMQWGPGGTEPCSLNGILDEVRVATAERSAGWIATEHANQSSPQTFYTVGAEEPVR